MKWTLFASCSLFISSTSMSQQAARTIAKKALVTGANGVFGTHIVNGLLSQEFEVICVVRNAAKGQKLIEQYSHYGDRCSFVLCDVSNEEDVKSLSNQLKDTPIDVLINNAAITPTSRQETSAGIEMQWATNVLAYHWMIKEFIPNLLSSSSAPARIVNVASFYAGELDLDDVEFKTRPYDNDAAYRASKQANRMMSKGWATIVSPEKVVVMSCHPGVATSGVSLGLGFDLDRSLHAAKEGAVTPLFLATSDTVLGQSGGYFSDKKEQRCSFSENAEAVARLMGLLDSYTSSPSSAACSPDEASA